MVRDKICSTNWLKYFHIGSIQRKLNDRDEGQELRRDCHRYSSIYTVDDNRLQLPESLQSQWSLLNGYFWTRYRLPDLVSLFNQDSFKILQSLLTSCLLQQLMDEIQDEHVHIEGGSRDEGFYLHQPRCYITLRKKVSLNPIERLLILWLMKTCARSLTHSFLCL